MDECSDSYDFSITYNYSTKNDNKFNGPHQNTNIKTKDVGMCTSESLSCPSGKDGRGGASEFKNELNEKSKSSSEFISKSRVGFKSSNSRSEGASKHKLT